MEFPGIKNPDPRIKNPLISKILDPRDENPIINRYFWGEFSEVFVKIAKFSSLL